MPCRFVANARPVYLLRNGKYRNTRGHFELAVLDAGDQLLNELSPDAIGPDLHRIYGQLSLQKEQRIRGRAVVLTTPGARENYFHWCLELLPKIHLLCSGGLFQPKKDIFLVKSRRRSLSDTNACVAWIACSKRCAHIPCGLKFRQMN